MSNQQNNLAKLTNLLQLAYSAEMAAAYAYRGHWRSLPEGDERSEIQVIEAEEWQHRHLIGGMLQKLEATPRRTHEIKFGLIGRILGSLCHLSGWFLPMYGAGKLESRNYREYELAAQYALACGYSEFLACLLEMAEVEWEHERYFRGKVEGHIAWLRFLPLWQASAPKESIRTAIFDQPRPLAALVSTI